MIEVIELKRLYKMGEETVHALDGVSFTLPNGSYAAIVGPSGSGKTTLMNLLGALDKPTSGQYILSGNSVHTLGIQKLATLRNQYIGFVFQNSHLLPRLTALENVELPLIYRGMTAIQRKKKAQEMLQKVGLSDRVKHYPNQLSGGQRQRVAIARALAGEPELLLADEPTGALDSRTGIEILELFSKLNQEGKTVIVVTHDQHVARKTHRILQMLDGKLVWDGDPQEWNP